MNYAKVNFFHCQCHDTRPVSQHCHDTGMSKYVVQATVKWADICSYFLHLISSYFLTLDYSAAPWSTFWQIFSITAVCFWDWPLIRKGAIVKGLRPNCDTPKIVMDMFCSIILPLFISWIRSKIKQGLILGLFTCQNGKKIFLDSCLGDPVDHP